MEKEIPSWVWFIAGAGVVWWWLERRPHLQVAAAAVTGQRPPGLDLTHLASSCPPGHYFLPAKTGGGGHCIPVPEGGWIPGSSSKGEPS